MTYSVNANNKLYNSIYSTSFIVCTIHFNIIIYDRNSFKFCNALFPWLYITWKNRHCISINIILHSPTSTNFIRASVGFIGTVQETGHRIFNLRAEIQWSESKICSFGSKVIMAGGREGHQQSNKSWFCYAYLGKFWKIPSYSYLLNFLTVFYL